MLSRGRWGWAVVSALLVAAACGDDGSGAGDAGGERDAGRTDDAGDPDGGGADAGGPVCECLRDADCDDGLYCNGTEVCDCTCAGGVPPACDDADTCTVDACSEEMRTCTHVAGDVDAD